MMFNPKLIVDYYTATIVWQGYLGRTHFILAFSVHFILMLLAFEFIIMSRICL